MARVRISQLAEDDLVEIWKFIADDNPFAATETVELIETKFHLLARQPEIGHNRLDLRAGLQSYSVGNYVIFFLPSKRPKGIDVVRVLEGHRDITGDYFYES